LLLLLLLLLLLVLLLLLLLHRSFFTTSCHRTCKESVQENPALLLLKYMHLKAGEIAISLSYDITMHGVLS
jgi:hypothetical protein